MSKRAREQVRKENDLNVELKTLTEEQKYLFDLQGYIVLKKVARYASKPLEGKVERS